MSLTKPRHYPSPAPPGEYSIACDWCGMEWYRSDLVRLPDGTLACPDDVDGRTAWELDRANQQATAAAAAWEARPRREKW
jgi:hypothetical protein